MSLGVPGLYAPSGATEAEQLRRLANFSGKSEQFYGCFDVFTSHCELYSTHIVELYIYPTAATSIWNHNRTFLPRLPWLLFQQLRGGPVEYHSGKHLVRWGWRSEFASRKECKLGESPRG